MKNLRAVYNRTVVAVILYYDTRSKTTTKTKYTVTIGKRERCKS